jgi:hypothetical protein
MPHDFDAQRAETAAAYTDLQDKHGLPEFADIDYFFVPAAADADWQKLAGQLSAEGYACEWVEEPDGGSYLIATLSDQIISAQGIWIGEEVATRAALAQGFAPDGWGLEG